MLDNNFFESGFALRFVHVRLRRRRRRNLLLPYFHVCGKWGELPFQIDIQRYTMPFRMAEKVQGKLHDIMLLVVRIVVYNSA
jgi:hypothetical protein